MSKDQYVYAILISSIKFLIITRVNQLFKTLGNYSIPQPFIHTPSQSLSFPGCKVSTLGERERAKYGVSDHGDCKYAVLTAPVTFPKPRQKRRT